MGITKQAVQSYTSQLRKLGVIRKPKRKRDEIAQLLAQGLTPKKIAQRLGLKCQNVYEHVHELRGIGKLPPLNRAAAREKLLRLLLTDLTLKEIGAQFGETPGTIGARAARIYRWNGARNRRELQRARTRVATRLSSTLPQTEGSSSRRDENHVHILNDSSYR